MKHLLKILLLPLLAIGLTACSDKKNDEESARYNGKTTPASFASLTSEQKNTLGKASSEVVMEAIGTSDIEIFDDFPLAAEINVSSNLPNQVKDKIFNTIKTQLNLNNNISNLSNLPIAVKANITEQCDLGGSYDISLNINDDTGAGSFSMTFKNCKEDMDDGDWTKTNGKFNGDISINNGTVTIKAEFSNFESIDFYNGREERTKISGYYQMTYEGDLDDIENKSLTYTAKWDLTGQVDGKRYASKGEMSCVNEQCTFGSDISIKGQTYRVENVKVNVSSSSDNTSASGRLYHPDYGYYSFEVSFDEECESDNNASLFVGTAKFIDSKSAQITYESTHCDSTPTITY